MKWVVVALLLLFFFAAGPAYGSCFSDREDVPCWAQMAYGVVAAVDMSQTRWHQAHGHKENNPLTPNDPSGINVSTALQVIAVIALSEMLPQPWGGWLLFARLGANTEAVYYNARMGIQVTW